MTGKGTTPEYVMNYLLSQNGLSISNVDLQFKSEAAEVASILKEDSTAIGVLPQPFAAAACIQNEALKTVLDLTEQWNLLNQESKSMLVTGVTVIRSDFLRENKAATELFLRIIRHLLLLRQSMWRKQQSLSRLRALWKRLLLLRKHCPCAILYVLLAKR